MATVKEELDRLKFLVDHGRADEKIHIVMTDEESAKRKENAGPKPKTRVIIETHSGHLYSQFQTEKDRIIRRVGNLSIALDLMLRAWQELTDDKIKAWLQEGEE